MTSTARPASTAPTAPTMAGTAARLVAAAAVLVSGLVHLQLYFDGYRDAPDANLGRSFVLNAVASVVVSAALLLRRDLLPRVAALALLAGTLAAFALSRTDRGIFGLSETGLRPSPQAGIALAAEIIGLVAVIATLVPTVGAGRALRPAVAVPAAVAVAALAVVGGVLWAGSDDNTVATPAAGSATANGTVAVSIAGFAFDAERLEVPVGTTVEWTNGDSFPHTVVAADGAFASDDISAGGTFRFTFDEPGTYDYICGIHPSMTGTIVVTG